MFHEPARLAALAALGPAEYVELASLLKLVGVSKSALSKHLSVLTDAGIVTVSPSATDRRGRRVALTAHGRAAFEAYLSHLEDLVRNARTPP